MSNSFNISVRPEIAAVKTIIDNIHEIDIQAVLSGVGAQDDAIEENVQDNKTIMSYIKGMIQELAQRGTPHVDVLRTSNAEYVDVTNITDKGVLVGIYQYFELPISDDRQGFFNLTIDGNVIYDGSRPFTYSNSTEKEEVSGSLSFNHRFNTSLQVQAKVSGGAIQIDTYVAYTTD